MTGPSSVAPMGRRLVALIIDWVLCYLIASSIVRHNVFTVTDAHYQDAQLVALLAVRRRGLPADRDQRPHRR